MRMQGRDDIDRRTVEAKLEFHENRRSGVISMLDSPQSYDKQGTVVALIVGVRNEGIVRCALSQHQALALASQLIRECM